MGAKENQIQKSCAYMLGVLAGCFVERNNSGVMKAAGWTNKRGEKSKDRFVRFGGEKGAPDLRATVPPDGHALAVECKTLEGSLSEDQKEWARKHRAAGGTYLACRSTIPLENWLRERGLLGGIAVQTKATHPELFP